MKYVLRKKIFNILIYGFITTIQKQHGITSIVKRGENLHFPLWDFDNLSLNEVIEALKKVKEEFNLNIIVIMSDKENSYRAIAPYDTMDFRKLCKVIISTENVDYLFFKWTVRRGYATIRLSDKKGRSKNKIIQVIGYDGKTPFIDLNQLLDFNMVDYETDLGEG